MRVSQGIQESFKKPFKQVSKRVSRGFQRCFKEFPYNSQVSFKGVSRKFKDKCSGVSKIFQALIRVFQDCSVLKVYCCMSLIAATRAEEGLVLLTHP